MDLSAQFTPTAGSAASKRTVKKTLLYAYYSGDYIGRNVAFDANGTSLIGYGYKGSANSQNRAINEITFGFNQTIWRDPRYGAINVMGQYEWLERIPGTLPRALPRAPTTTPFTSMFVTLCRVPCRTSKESRTIGTRVLCGI